VEEKTVMRKLVSGLSIAALLGAAAVFGCGPQGGRNDVADLAIVNAKVWTVNPAQPTAEAVAIVGERIAAVGSEQEVHSWVGERTRVIDAGGKLLLPGFNDAHTHFMGGGFSLLGIDLRKAKNEEEFVRILEEYVSQLPKGKWVTGGDWDHEAWPSQKHPTKELIDPVTPDNPVIVNRLDGHISLANSLALKMAGITRNTPDPFGGEIVRDPKTGEPTGILIDNAQSLVYRLVPEPTEEEYLEAARAAMRHAARLGVTSVQDMASAQDFRIYQKLWRQGELLTRIYAIRSIDVRDELRRVGLQAAFGDAMLRTGAVKIFADGSMGAGSALFYEPYEDDPSTSGLAIQPEEELYEMVQEADAAGLQIALHAIGDKANHWALNAFERAIKANGRRDSRHRIEHAQVVRPEDLPRFREMGVIASIEPSHCIDDMRWAEKRIGDRTKYSYLFKSFVDAGARLAFGTDWTVEPLDPMLGLYAAVTREFPEGGPAGGWYPEEKITIEQAIEYYTLGSAYAEFQEHKKGSIQPGKLADLVLLSKDILTIPAREILSTEVEMTVLGGKVIFEKGVQP
jgi:predicted amidohydrolase YtcJ